MNTIQGEWESYASEVIPKDAPKAQIIETRRAFYAAAYSLMSMLANVGDMSEEAGTHILNNITLELDQFINDLRTGKA